MELLQQLDFVMQVEGLKSVLRTAWSATGRHESTAEHSWRLSLFAALLAPSFGVDVAKVMLMSLIHDIGELYSGDISAALMTDSAEKYTAEQRDARYAFSFLPVAQAEQFMALWEEYNANETPEARLVKALDKAETILQHTQGQTPRDFDFAFNLEYGKHLFEDDALLGALREQLDARTREAMRRKEARQE